MRSPMKRITGQALIELRREMYKDVKDGQYSGQDAILHVLMAEIDRLKHDHKYKQNFTRINRLQDSCSQAWAKIDHLKAQLYKMVKGYEKKIVKLEIKVAALEAKLETTPVQ